MQDFLLLFRKSLLAAVLILHVTFSKIPLLLISWQIHLQTMQDPKETCLQLPYEKSRIERVAARTEKAM